MRSGNTKRAKMAKVIMDLGGPVAASKEQAIERFKRDHPEIKEVDQKTFYVVRRRLTEGPTKPAKTTEHPAVPAIPSKLQPSQLVRQVRRLVDLYGKEELKDLIDELS